MQKFSNKVKITFIFLTAMIAVVWVGASKLFNNSTASQKFSVVPIAMALDDNYLYPTVVAMTSILENADSKTKYDFYIMHPPEFKEENKTKLKSLERKYEKCTINTIDMGNAYKDANNKGLATPTYYRLSLSELLPNCDKILWLDGDVLVFKDLKEMYDLDMEGIYYSGFLDLNVNGFQSFNSPNSQGICAGVMVINLAKLREDNMVQKFEQFIKENNDSLSKHDQTVINMICHDKIGVLPPQFGMFNFSTTAEGAKFYSDKLTGENKYSYEDMYNGFNELTVLHCVNKPWTHFYEVPFGDKWWEYAEKTDFYDEMVKEYNFVK